MRGMSGHTVPVVTQTSLWHPQDPFQAGFLWTDSVTCRCFGPKSQIRTGMHFESFVDSVMSCSAALWPLSRRRGSLSRLPRRRGTAGATLWRASAVARATSTVPWFLESRWRDTVEILDCRSGTPVPAARACAGRADVVICCEHASNKLPPGYAWSEADKRLVHDHWAYDPGAGDCALEVAVEMRAVVLLARWSRLLVDCNRAVSADTLFLRTADGKPVELNVGLSDAERVSRITSFYLPFHTAVHACLAELRPSLLLSIHSFTRAYGGERREHEVGCLFSTHDDLAPLVHADFRGAGFIAGLNTPWSGREGFMHAVDVARGSLFGVARPQVRWGVARAGERGARGSHHAAAGAS